MVVRTGDGVLAIRPNDDTELADHTYEIPAHRILETRAHGDTICAFYHSHPDGPARTSVVDIEAMKVGEHEAWPEVDWVIVSVNRGRATNVGQYVWDENRRDFDRHTPEIRPC